MSEAPPPRAVGADPWIQNRLQAATEVLGRRMVAKFLGVPVPGLARWINNNGDHPGLEVVLRVIDLDHVLARGRLIWGSGAVRIWMASPNVYLRGARPIDVLKADGAAVVIEVLNAEIGGGAA